MKWRNDKNISRYAEEYKAKYLEFDWEKNLKLKIMGLFLVSPDNQFDAKYGSPKTSAPQ